VQGSCKHHPKSRPLNQSLKLFEKIDDEIDGLNEITKNNVCQVIYDSP